MLQLKEAGEQERALTDDLREVKQLKETAVCESMPGGVRGRGSNPPTYSIDCSLCMYIFNFSIGSDYFPDSFNPFVRIVE